MTTYENKLRLVEEVDFKGIFTEEEFKTYRGVFVKYDENKSNSLEIFELHRMYEDRGETKTNVQLKQLIKDADPQASDAISYKSFLTIIMKDKKGLNKSALGSIFVELLKPVEAKVHKGGLANKSNMFEQQAANQTNSYVEEENIRRQRAAKAEEAKRKREATAKLKAEEEEAARKEAERKKKVAAGLAKLKANINN
eukprot:TRINITY_DN3926_c0_g1_i1.p1 TRINITY_DN3926_c0_g1~~TRINITY_DN3926_c0_g1_i1.p1  ORF type:complete len:210 (-),score=80.27 TRINITY_DN3926_c0_g1_i1:2-592(-)